MFVKALNSSRSSQIEVIILFDLRKRLNIDDTVFIIDAKHFVEAVIECDSHVTSRLSGDVELIKLLLNKLPCGTTFHCRVFALFWLCNKWSKWCTCQANSLLKWLRCRALIHTASLHNWRCGSPCSSLWLPGHHLFLVFFIQLGPDLRIYDVERCVNSVELVWVVSLPVKLLGGKHFLQGL